jgi:predicted Zn finger-like uncharacterized protein
MILTCEKCDTSFNFPDNLIKDTGSKVRCSKCRHIFVAYAGAGGAPQTPSKQDPAVGDPSGLDDVNVNEIEAMLDLDMEEVKETPSADTTGSADFNLDLEEDVAGTSSPMDFEETQELDFSDMDLDEDSEGGGGSGAGGENLDFDLGLDFEDTDASPEAEVPMEADETKELSFELDLDDETGSGSDSAVTEAVEDESSDELDFELDLDLDAGDDIDEAAADMELEETQELDVSDMDNLLDHDDEPAAEAQSDELDFELDLGPEAESGAEAAAPEEKIDDATDELDFDLDLEEEPAISDAGAAPGPEATAELELSELEGMIDDEEGPGADSEPELASEDLDFGLDMESETAPKTASAAPEAELEETEEFDLSELDEMLGEDGEPAGPAEAADGTDDLDFTLDIADEAEQSIASDAEFEETAEFDLSDLENMLEEVDEPAAVGAGSQELDMALDGQETEAAAELFDGDDSADVELEFEIDDNAATVPQAAEAAAGSATVGADETLGDTFDMGTLTDEADEINVEDADLAYAELDEEDLAPTKKFKSSGRRGLSGPFRILLMLVLLVGGGYAAYTLSETMGFEIPFLKELKEIKIPYVSDLLGTEVADPGNLKIRILSKKVDGWFVTNKKSGTIFVVKGQVKNVYNHPRNFIRITAKIYSKGGVHSRIQTVYAGNLLTDRELVTLAPNNIKKRLNRQFGEKKSNLKVKTGKVVPFMAVFPKLPPNPDEYTVEVASSIKG